jgi:hypothetical protein
MEVLREQWARDHHSQLTRRHTRHQTHLLRVEDEALAAHAEQQRLAGAARARVAHLVLRQHLDKSGGVEGWGKGWG